MKTRTVGGNVIEIEELRAPERSFFGLFAREREGRDRATLLKSQFESKLLPSGADRPGDPR